VHNISLPPKQFGCGYITDFFLGKLDSNAHPYFEEIAEIKVSAHCLITREGRIIQYVSFDNKAWHAGVSSYKGLDKCNDFSVGIELEGTDDIAYTAEQYQTLAQLTKSLQQNYPAIKNNITGHSDIAPQRKTDPGEAFNWQHFHDCLKSS
jgi:AmpD protein